jgi:hypothetical protein
MGTSYITGKYTASPVAGADGQDIQVAVDQYGNVKTAGAGTAGSPSGGVQSVQSPGATNETATIANGASLSGAVDLGAGAILSGIQMPAAWTAAGLTFQVSADGVTYANKFDAYGSEYSVPSASATASQFISLPPSDFLGVRYIKVRSGTAGSAVAQGAERLLTLVAAS